METPSTPVLLPTTVTATAIRYGLLLAVSSVLVDFLVRIVGLSFLTYGIVAFLTAAVLAIVWLVLAHSAFKKANGNLMSFSQGLTIAIIVLLISFTATSLFNYVHINYIDTDFIVRLKLGMTEFMERNNVPDDQIAQSTAKFDEMNVGLGMSLLNGLKNGIFVGLVLGALVSAFTKRKAPQFE